MKVIDNLNEEVIGNKFQCLTCGAKVIIEEDDEYTYVRADQITSSPLSTVTYYRVDIRTLCSNCCQESVMQSLILVVRP